ncbi:MAG: hypothetical protein KKG59_04195 [Nanoarchaeota archaeon]|nr:hypothetical protein [Nanoarchaeota archaeon]
MLLLVFIFRDPTNVSGFAVGPPPSIATRSFDPVSPVLLGTEITVSFVIDPLWGETFFAMEEYVPDEFTVTDYYDDPDDNFDVYFDEENNIIKWVYVNLDNPSEPIPPGLNIHYYTVTAPDTITVPGTPETFVFDGQIQFEDDPGPAAIEGDTDMVVEDDSCTDECNQGDIECVDGLTYLECDDYDEDPCLEFGGDTFDCGTLDCSVDVCEAITYYDFVDYNFATRGTCTNTCDVDHCVDCNPGVGVCAPQSQTCNEANECTDSTFNPCGTQLKCIFDTAYIWKETPDPESACSDTHDNDCNNECDHDSSNCDKGDVNCPVGVIAVNVEEYDPENPIIEYSDITVVCTVDSGEVNSLVLDIDGVVCAGGVWDVNDVTYTCNVGAYPAEGTTKTITCSVDTDKSYALEGFEVQTIDIELLESVCIEYTPLGEVVCNAVEGCTFCFDCIDLQSSGFGENRCIEEDLCIHRCIAGECLAECDPENVCAPTDCEDACEDCGEETCYSIFMITDLPTECLETCACGDAPPVEDCGEGTLEACGETLCEDTYTEEKHLVGSCQNSCGTQAGDDECNTCVPVYDEQTQDCGCEPGWEDEDGVYINGCEAACNEPWVCGAWSGDGCGDRICACACGGVGCTGDHSTHLECPTASPVIFKDDGGSPIIFKGDSSPVVFKGSSPNIFKGGGAYDRCIDGFDNEGDGYASNGCIDEDDYLCGGDESYCWGGVDNDCDGDIDCDDSDCGGDSHCEVVEDEEDPPVYTVAEVIETLFGSDQTQNEETPGQATDSVAEVEYFFGFLNWVVIGVLAFLFLGLIFVQHIRPKLNKFDIPDSKLSGLEKFVQAKRAAGMGDDEIAKKLRSVGWIDEVIQKELKSKTVHLKKPENLSKTQKTVKAQKPPAS